MLSLVWSHFSLRAVEAEASADGRIHRNALRVFVERETTNTWMAQLVFLAVAIAGLFFQSVFVLCLGLLHMLVDQAVRNRVRRLAAGLERDEVDRSALGQIERVFYLVGFTWAMATWPLATSLDGLRLILTVVAASGVLVMANTTCFAPRVFRAALTGFAVGSLATLFVIETMPWYVLGAGVAILLGVATGVGVATSRQLVQMLRMQVERDEAIEGQQRTIAALDRARRIATSMAETDSLTGLANRFRFLTRLDDCIENGRPFSLTLLDVDLFKNVNDALGHSVGDEVLKAVGRVLATFEAENCFAARLGGDEFALIDARGTFVPMGAALFEAVRERIDSLPREAPDLPPISITGGSAYFPQDADARSDLLAAADIAQREAKKTRRGAHFDYSTRLSNMFWREAQIAEAIGHAVAARALVISLQPKINLRTGRLEGAEALSRFTHAGLAAYGLDEIFAVAEKRGLGAVLDELVLDRYRETLVALRVDHAVAIPTSVNLSGAILKTPERLLARLKALVAAGVDPGLVRVEITENAIYGRGQAAVVELLDRIVALGFTLALDDFGTGSGSLQHLLSLPVSEIKIDRSFVSGMIEEQKKTAIVRGLIVTGRAMSVEIVAEGVETEHEAELLRSMGAQYAQGFLWSRALAPREFVEFSRMFGRRAKSARPSPVEIAARSASA